MSPWEFRWVLLAIGVAVLVGIWWFSRHQENERHRRVRFDDADYEFDPLLDDGDRRGPEIPDDLPPLDPGTDPGEPVWTDPEGAGPQGAEPEAAPERSGQGKTAGPVEAPGAGGPQVAGAVASGREPARPGAGARASMEQAAAPAEKDGMLIVFHLVMKKPYQITGESLLRAAEEFGLVHGPMGIFHYYDTRAGREPVFSMANLVKPGTFDLDAMDEFSTPGLTLFMQLPVGMDALEAFETLLSTVQGLANRFGARILDDTRSTLTQQTVEHLREQLRMSELRRGARVAPVH